MWENITLEIGLRGTDTNNPISCLDIRRFNGLWLEHILQTECHDTTWRWCSSLKRSCSETSGGDEIGYRVLGDHKSKKKKEEERQNEKRRPALMQRRGSAGYYEFFRNLKDSSKAWLSVHTRVRVCLLRSGRTRAGYTLKCEQTARRPLGRYDLLLKSEQVR